MDRNPRERIQELLEAINREVERRRAAEQRVRELEELFQINK
jgi:hypothetical protein